ncbi:MAG: undecaprenyl/decaprenyl-phosphate alpha-N-acetylglucosaminyl 1-phosphate transferase [Paludibacteraceae bacterium]|nr:undecaprenyl/decaprenyl-phosphate alpha-N-acetylglucosaminyl 1-phosphate transferase [Paludibacteraceae bacterium]
MRRNQGAMTVKASYLLLYALTAFLLTWFSYRPVLRIAIKRQVVDHPNKRKLQDQPVPVLGGVAVAIGVFIPLIYATCHYVKPAIWYQIAAMAIMLIIGILDDIYDVPAWIRLMVEIVVIWLFLWGTQSVIDDFHGLFGIRNLLSMYIGLPLSILAGVGIVNAINLIDGVDGYSSGYGIMANACFTVVFAIAGDAVSAVFSIIAAAALIPFFFHNVFGNKSKMFIGDGGSLLIGMILVCDVFVLLTHQTVGTQLAANGVGVVALALAILCIPIFDTLRVMFARMLHKRSPMQADKTHLHHRFIALGFSHVGTSTIIILTNLVIILLWYLSFRIGCSVDTQFWLVVVLGILTTTFFYYGTEWCEKRQNKVYFWLRRLGQATHFEHNGVWLRLQTLLDRGL